MQVTSHEVNGWTVLNVVLESKADLHWEFKGRPAAEVGREIELDMYYVDDGWKVGACGVA